MVDQGESIETAERLVRQATRLADCSEARWCAVIEDRLFDAPARKHQKRSEVDGPSRDRIRQSADGVTSGSRLPIIAFGVDENYVEPMLVALVSVATVGAVDASVADVRVLHRGLSGKTRDRIARVASGLELDLELIQVPGADASFPVSDWVSEAVYLRLRLGEAITEAPVLLYLDCDLVATDSLRPLLAERIDRVVGAVRSTPNPLLQCDGALPGWRDIGLPADREYFNSGVMLIDLDRWRAEEIGIRSAQFIADHPEHIRFWDQDALNVVIDDEWTRLSGENNVVALSPLMPGLIDQYRGGDVLSLEDALAMEDTARILHFAGPLKPWLDVFPDVRAGQVYREFQAALVDLESAER